MAKMNSKNRIFLEYVAKISLIYQGKIKKAPEGASFRVNWSIWKSAN
jgi:hypothetical protein